MAGWDIAGKNDAAPREAPFGRRSKCSLTVSPTVDDQHLTPADWRALFGAACAHSGCLKCGPLRAQHLLLPFAGSLEHIKCPVVHLVLRYAVVEVGPSGLLAYSQFLDASRLLASLLQQGAFGDFHVWCLVAEVAPLNTSQARPHLHLAFSRTSLGLLPLSIAINKVWVTLGGECQGAKAMTFSDNLARVLRYMAKGPLGESYGSLPGRACARFLLDPLEHMTRVSAALYYRGGILVDPSLRRASRARARTLQHQDTSARDHIGNLRDQRLASTLPESLAALHVEHKVQCPTCRRSGPHLTRNGHDARNRQRWRCKKCSRSFRDRPVSQKQAEHLDNVRRASVVRRLVDREGMALNEVARSLHLGRPRAKSLYEWHAGRWPKPARHP